MAAAASSSDTTVETPPDDTHCSICRFVHAHGAECPVAKAGAAAKDFYKTAIESRIGGRPAGFEEGHEWKAYETLAGAPFHHAKWCIMYPLQRRMFPWFTFTWGELIILIIVLGLTGFSFAQVNDVEGSGSPPSVGMGFVFGMVPHNSMLTFLLGIPFERALLYHKFFALIAVALGFFHGWVAIVDEGGWQMGDGDFASGVYLQAFMAALLVFSVYPWRRKVFEFFYYSHWVLFLGTLLFGLIHGAGGPFGFGVVLWIVDVLYRLYLAFAVHPRSAEIVALPSDVLRLRFKRGDFRYKGGQYLFICIPKIGGMGQWHPFSISSAPFETEVCVHIRVLGNWTRRLYDLAKDNGGRTKVSMFFEGAYGEPAIDVDSTRYKIFLMVSGGIGITPMQSITNDLLYQYSRGRPLEKIIFIWSCRDKYMVSSIYDRDFQKPTRLPLSFSPDLLLAHHNSMRKMPSERQRSPTAGAVTASGAASATAAPAAPVDVEVSADRDKAEIGDDDPLHSEHYLTRCRTAADYKDANIHPDVQKHLFFGRPNLPEIFERVAEYAREQGEPRVGVLTCGPSGMVADCQELAYRTKGVRFDFHSETFLF